MDGLVHGRRGERLVVVPVDVEHAVGVRAPLLLDLARVELPEADRVVERAGEEHRAERVPLEREDGALVHRQDEVQVARRPGPVPGRQSHWVARGRRRATYVQMRAMPSSLPVASRLPDG